MEEESPPIHFICGMSRAGTTWMAQCLNTHKHCAAFGETLFWGRLYIEKKNNTEYDENIFETLITRLGEIKLGNSKRNYGSLKPETVEGWQNDMPTKLLAIKKRTPKELFEHVCQYVLTSENKSVAIEKTPHHINWLPRITNELPNSKFVIMVREPYGFMKSYKFQGIQRGVEIRLIFEKQYHPIQAALIWRGYANSILGAIKQYENKVIVVRNEDLHAHAKEILLDVAAFLNLPSDSEFASELPPRTNSSIMGNEELKLDVADIFWLNLVAKKQIPALGYAFQYIPFEIMPIIKSVITLPLWFYRVVVFHRKNSKASLFKYFLRWLK